MSLREIQNCLFIKNYQKLEQQLHKITTKDENSLQSLFLDTIQIKLQLYKTLKKSVSDRQSIEHFQHSAYRLQQKYKNLRNENKKIYILSLSFFIFELRPKKQLNIIKNNGDLQRQQQNTEQKQMLASLLLLPQPVESSISNSSIYFTTSLIQLYTKKLIKTKRIQSKSITYFLISAIQQLNKSHPQTIDFCKKIQLILIHLRIYFLNNNIDKGYQQVLHEIINLIIGIYQQKIIFINDLLIVLLYNVLKILLGLYTVSNQIKDLLKTVFQNNNIKMPENYNQIVFRLFLIIKMLIFKQSPQQKQNHQHKQNKHQSTHEQDSVKQIEGQDQLLCETFSSFLNINFDTTIVELKQVTRSIIRHRVASLATIIGFKLGIENLALNFLQTMHDSPYNNDIQTIKLCFQLFSAREFSKLQHLFQMVLSASSCKSLKQRQVLIAMCSIFIGIYLQKREQGLLYAKLNHFQNKKHILRQQTLLQHLGFSYYNLAKSQVYLQNRQIYLVKALENFNKSYQINPNNYVVAYCISKVYIRFYQYQKAYKFALESCKCNRGRWLPFALLACVYMVQRKIHKALVIVDQLLKKYPDQAIIYYMRAYLEVNKILLQVEHDEQVQAAKTMDEEIYELTKDRVLKSKSLSNLNMYCQMFYNKSRSQSRQVDENYFNNTSNFSQDLRQSQNNIFQGYISDKSILLMIIKLFIQVQQLSTAQSLLRTIPQSQQSCQSKHYKTLLHIKRKQPQLALEQSKKILQKQNMHVDSLLQCALLENNQSEAFNYVMIAAKFNNQSKLNFTKGMVLSRINKFQEAHQCFIKHGDVAWLEELPEKLYYY